ncbi:MAG: AraC family transcriptional regulator [Caldimonas sp.]
MSTPPHPAEHPRRAAVLVAHSSPVVALGLACILADRRGAVVELVDARACAPSSRSAPRHWLTIGDTAGVRAHQRRHPHSRGAVGERLMIGPTLPDAAGRAERWISLDCPEAEFLEAVDRWLDDGAICAAAMRNANRGFAPGVRARVLAHIEKHLGEPIDAVSLARLVGLSTCHFARAFKQSFGAPPHRYVLRRRLEQAAHRLREPEGSLSAIALESGFSDQSHFTRCFGRWAGETPSAYRTRHRDAQPSRIDPAH